jgi:hypothetical protein
MPTRAPLDSRQLDRLPAGLAPRVSGRHLTLDGPHSLPPRGVGMPSLVSLSEIACNVGARARIRSIRRRIKLVSTTGWD